MTKRSRCDEDLILCGTLVRGPPFGVGSAVVPASAAAPAASNPTPIVLDIAAARKGGS